MQPGLAGTGPVAPALGPRPGPARPLPAPAAPARSRGPLLPGFRAAAASLEARGMPVPPLEGKLLRPRVALALLPSPVAPEALPRFWSGALAVQMVHEASLLHDDIVDDAPERRGEPTLVARRGVAASLVLGDHYLTAAYRAAAATGAPDFLHRFIEAVERTVAGEVAQGRAAGRVLDEATYDACVDGKSGALFGAAACLGAVVTGRGDPDERVSIGRALGALYQRVDDLLDYCPAADTGKAPLQDYAQGKWTWIMGVAGIDRFDLEAEELLERLFRGTDGGRAPARQGLDDLSERAGILAGRIRAEGAADTELPYILAGWLDAAGRAVARQEAAL